MENALVPVEQESELSPREAAVEALTPAERYAYQYASQTRQYEISPATADGMYDLFLHGTSCEEIRRQNTGYSLGQIVHARVRDLWDQRRQEHDARLLADARPNAQRIGLEAVQHVGLKLAASHKLEHDKLLRFLQSGDAKDLEDVQIGGLKGYKELVGMLQQLTGQAQTSKVSGEVFHRVETVSTAPEAKPAPVGTALTPAQAARMLAVLEDIA